MEHIVNTKNTKNQTLPQMEKKTEPLGCMLHHLIDNIFFLFLNLFITILLTSSSCLREPFILVIKLAHSSSFFQASFFKILVSVLVPHTNQTENLVPILVVKRFEFSFQFQNSDLVLVQVLLIATRTDNFNLPNYGRNRFQLGWVIHN